MSTLQVNTLDSYTGSTINVDSTANLTISNTTTATSSTTGALQVVGGISTQENLYVGGNAVITGTMTANGGTITLGDAGTDNVTIGGEINSDVIPDATNTYDLGSSSKKWAEIHATTFTGALTGNVTGNVSGTITGNADTATALAATKTIGMTGDVVWTSAGFDGSGNVTGTAAIQSDTVAATELGVTAGTATASKALVVDASKDINLGTGDLTATVITGALTGNVTGNVTGNTSGSAGSCTGNAATATKFAATKTIGMTGDVVWTSAGFDGSGNVTGTATIQANSVALGTDTTGNYMSNVSAGTGVTISHTPAEGSTGTVAIGQSVATSAEPSFDGLTITGNDFVTIPAGTNAQRGSPSTGSIRYSSTDSTFEGYNGSNWGSLGGVKDVDGDTYITAETTSGGDQDVLTLVAGGTTGLTVSATTTTVAGNLTVSGTTTTINTETINLADNTIVLNSNEAGTPSQNGGIEIERGTSTNKSLLWDETNDKWTVGSETLVAGTFEGTITSANVSGLTSEVADTVTATVDPDSLSSNSTTAYNTADWGDLTTSTGTSGFVNEPIRATTYQDLAIPATTTSVDWGALA